MPGSTQGRPAVGGNIRGKSCLDLRWGGRRKAATLVANIAWIYSGVAGIRQQRSWQTLPGSTRRWPAAGGNARGKICLDLRGGGWQKADVLVAKTAWIYSGVAGSRRQHSWQKLPGSTRGWPAEGGNTRGNICLELRGDCLNASRQLTSPGMPAAKRDTHGIGRPPLSGSQLSLLQSQRASVCRGNVNRDGAALRTCVKRHC